MNRNDFLALLERPLRETVVAIDGSNYRLREMTEEQGTEYELSLQDKKGNVNYATARRALIAMMLIDDDGNRMVTHESELRRLPRSIAGKLFDECQKLNRYETGEVKELVKNSDGADD
jgi:hypothetical protein